LVIHDQQPTRILTQTDLIRFIHLHADKFPFLEDTIQQVDSNQVKLLKNVHSVTGNTLTLQVFRSLQITSLEAIPIVDDKGIILSSFSSGLVRGFTHEKVKDLFLPVSEFISQHGVKSYLSKVNSSTTLRQVIQIMVRSLEMTAVSHTRLVWVVDDDSRPIGSVSMSDITNYFYISTLSVWF